MSHDNDVRDRILSALADPHQVCERLMLLEGAKRQANGLSIRCPAHNENNASCSVTVGPDATLRVKCFSCDFAGSVLDLIGAVERLDMHRDFPKILEHGARLAGIDTTESAPRSPAAKKQAPPPPPLPDYTACWDAMPALDADGWEYLRGRGIEAASSLCRSPSDVNGLSDVAALVSAGFRLAVALRDADGRVRAIQFRRIDHEKGFRVVGASSAGLFGQPHLVEKARFVIVAEGLTDTLAAFEAASETTAIVGVAGVQAGAALAQLPVKGKRIYIATDADEAGDKAAEEFTRQFVARGATVVRARPAVKDLAELVAAGSTVADLISRSAAASVGLQLFGERVKSERASRLAMQDRYLGFGMKFLDKALGGIAPNDLILLGAKTGLGKTQLATLIAIANASKGRRVHYLALEAEPDEIERRIKYRFLSNLIYKRGVDGETAARLNYLDWHMCRLEDITGPHEELAERLLADEYRSLYTLYRHADFDISDLERAVMAVEDSTDLVIVDHLHYIDSDDANENRGMKAIVKRIRDLALDLGKPVVVVAHVRKGERKGGPLIPTVEDFHGTSDIAKIATKAVMIAPAYDQPSSAPHLLNTYVHAIKCRPDGSRTRHVGLVAFNVRTNSYDRDFVLGKLIKGGEAFQFTPDEELPAWARDIGH